MNRGERRELFAEVRRVVGKRPVGISFPGGESRQSVRVALAGGANVIVTRRPSATHSNREVAVLRALRQGNAPVPAVHSFRDGILIQEDLGDTRLSQVLHQETPRPNIPALLAAALDGLAQCQEAARRSQIDGLDVIGQDPGWCGALARTPETVAEIAKVPVPDYDADSAAEVVAIKTPSFVKWDSRPGNALVPPSGDVRWFDWEHCGLRNALDDVVWLMADEFVTYNAKMEQDLFDAYLSRFAPDLSRDEARRYVRIMGVFHTCVRLELALRYREEHGDWWSLSHCLDGDKVGVTRRCCRRMVWRGEAWADRDPITRPLSAWFSAVGDYVESV